MLMGNETWPQFQNEIQERSIDFQMSDFQMSLIGVTNVARASE